MLVLLAAAFGLLIGSFLNVVVHRVPADQSVVTGRSACPACGHPIRAYDNVPVLSWLVLRGRCRDCGAPIPARYPLVELVTAALWALAAATGDGPAGVALGALLVSALVPITLIDVEHRRIPNAVTLPAAVLAVVLGTALDADGEIARLVAGAGAAAFLLVPALVRPDGMGLGDVKLAGVMGLCLGPPVAVALLVALVAGSAWGLALAARRGVADARRTTLPFGPYLALGGVVALVVGDAVVDAYLSTF
ncbi:prepilin peptidase [Patulibacter sp. S7RM1-6]